MNAPITSRCGIQRIFWCGILVTSLAWAGQPGRATTIFDNTSGIFNGALSASSAQWLASRFCVGPQPYTLDSVVLLLNSGDINRPHVSTVRLQIYSQTNNRPAVSTGLKLNLSGLSNPITLGLADRLVTWTPAAPFHLAANTCYWLVLSVDSGDVIYATVSQTQPAGDVGTLGWGLSFDAGATWGAPDLFNNFKMLIQGTAIPTPLRAVDGATAIPGGTGHFTSLPRGPSLSGSSVAFFGAGSDGQQGIYVQNRFIPGDPVRIADLNTPIPNGSGNFLSFAGEPAIPTDPIIPSDPLISGDNVVFYGTGSGGQRGIYGLINSSRLRVADTSTAIPGGSGNTPGLRVPAFRPIRLSAGTMPLSTAKVPADSRASMRASTARSRKSPTPRPPFPAERAASRPFRLIQSSVAMESPSSATAPAGSKACISPRPAPSVSLPTRTPPFLRASGTS